MNINVLLRVLEVVLKVLQVVINQLGDAKDGGEVAARDEKSDQDIIEMV